MEAEPEHATILVIDDDETVTGLIRTVLEKDGYTVLTAHSGADGLMMAREKKPDLIIMDISMPDMDGYEATESLKRERELREIPVLFLSGKSPGEDGGRSFASGGLTFIRKPFSNQQIRGMVRLTLQSIVT